jgi:hypothetical protein
MVGEVVLHRIRRPINPGNPPTAENRLIGTGGISYTYDGDGKRVKKSNGMLYWTGTGPDVLLETDLSGNPTAEYMFFSFTPTYSYIIAKAIDLILDIGGSDVQVFGIRFAGDRSLVG